MNKRFYECTVRYKRVLDDGRQKKVSEKYLVEAMSFCEAETRIMEEVAQYISGEFEVTVIHPQKFDAIYESKNAKAKNWYKGQISFFYIDERTGREKNAHETLIVRAKDFDDARNVIEEGMKGSMTDWKKTVLRETEIVDFYKLSNNGNSEK